MSQVDFDRFLDSYTIEKEERKIDAEQEKKDWLESVDNLYKQIEKWLQRYIQEGKVTVERDINKTIGEDVLGGYNIDIMTISFANQEVKLNPIGRMVIGAKGRIDLQGRRHSIKLVLVDKELSQPNIKVKVFTSEKDRLDYIEKQKNETPKEVIWVWKIATPPPNMSFIELDESTFFDALMEVIDA
ncbi:MAG: hypothetical protein HPY53_15545 [Brevinematales bacterium]|nr:hypothetical protein [Brevinematales bacterium]